VLSGGQPGPHKIQGIGAGLRAGRPRPLGHRRGGHGRQPDRLRHRARARRLEGIPGGISTGANVAAALEIASRPDMKDKTILTFACSFAERYISSALFEGL
jgi:cysteine synthase A